MLESLRTDRPEPLDSISVILFLPHVTKVLTLPGLGGKWIPTFFGSLYSGAIKPGKSIPVRILLNYLTRDGACLLENTLGGCSGVKWRALSQRLIHI
jgi:hypothetical protein